MRLLSLSSTLVLFCLGATAVPASAGAGDASAWVEDAYSRVRLIAGSNPAANEVLRAGITIELQPGWKTYWRYPGDSGVPPQFNFDGSDNVRSVQVLWPAPQRFSDGGGHSIGYHDHLVLPLRVLPKNPGKPVVLNAKLSYAICKNLCVPAEAEARLDLRHGASTLDASLAAAESQVPVSAKLGADGSLAIRSVRREEAKPLPRVVVEVAAPTGSVVDLFVEGPTPDWALPLPDPGPTTSTGQRTFSFALDGVPPGATTDGAELTFTLVADDKAIEVKSRLD